MIESCVTCSSEVTCTTCESGYDLQSDYTCGKNNVLVPAVAGAVTGGVLLLSAFAVYGLKKLALMHIVPKVFKNLPIQFNSQACNSGASISNWEQLPNVSEQEFEQAFSKLQQGRL